MLGLKILLRCFAILLTLQPMVEGIRYFRHQMLLRPTPRSIVYPSQSSNHSTKYSPWSPWSVCTRTCGTGLIMRSRSCLKRISVSNPANDPACRGDLMEHKICSLQECPAGSLDFRSSQCSQYNNRIIAGQMVSTWMASEGGHNPCELRCEAKREKLVYGFGKVADGTSCSADNSAICLDGRCLTVGCNGNLGSGIAVDMCGVCGGRNATCIHYKDVYLGQPSGGANERRGSRNEYREVAVIPVGARNLEIVQPTGKNILAMQDQNNGFIFHGKDALSTHRGKYHVSGTSVNYLQANSTIEVLRAEGPTTMDLYVLVLLRDRNPGIRYQYWLPKDENHLKLPYLFSTSTSPSFSANQQVSPVLKITDHTTPLPSRQVSPRAVETSVTSFSAIKKPVTWNNQAPVKPTSSAPKVTNDHFFYKTKTTFYDDFESKHTQNVFGDGNIQKEKTSSYSTTSLVDQTTPHPRQIIFRDPLPKPRFKTPKPALGYYQMYRKEVESINDPSILYSKNLKNVPDDALGDSGSANGGRWRQSLEKGSHTYRNKSRTHEDKSSSKQSANPPSGNIFFRNPIIYQNLNSRWAYKLGENGEENIKENEYRGRYASTPVTIAVLPLPETYSHNTTEFEKKRGGRKHSKSRLTRGGLCGPCQKVRDQTKHFCHSDFVIRASIVDYEFLHGETRYEMQVLQSFKNTLPLLPREYIWAPDMCKCPKLRVGREYILMGKSDKTYRKNESRLLVDKNCFVRSYNAKYGKRFLRLRKDQRRKCRKVS